MRRVQFVKPERQLRFPRWKWSNGEAGIRTIECTANGGTRIVVGRVVEKAGTTGTWEAPCRDVVRWIEWIQMWERVDQAGI